MTDAERAKIADLTDRIERLEQQLAKLCPPPPRLTSTDLYPKRDDEV